jgi:hypothetical protein
MVFRPLPHPRLPHYNAVNNDVAVDFILEVFTGSSVEQELVAAAPREPLTSSVDYQRRAQIIRRARSRRESELGPLRAHLAILISEVGWTRARPIVASVLGYQPTSPRGSWLKHMGKRNARRIVAGLGNLPGQRRLPLG